MAERSHIKIPKSYLNRWIHVRPEETKPILTLAPDEGRFFVGTPPDTVEGEDARKKIRHPLFEAHFSEASWHSPLTITEYAYSVTRSYTGGGGEGVTLTYQDRFGVDVAFGDTFQTEGFSLDLNPRGIGGVLERAVPGINQGEPVWRPSLLKAFKVIISMYTDDGNVPIVGSPFLLDDVVALLLSIPRTTADTLSLRGLVETLKVAGGAPDLGERCRTYFRRKSDPDSEEPEDYGGAVPPTDDPLIAARAKTLENTIQSLAGSVSRQADPVASARDFLPTWVRRTLLNTLGIVAVTALQEYSGATDKDVGYAVAPDSWDNGSTARVYLYDRARFGNGNADAGRRYFYVPHLLRHGLTSASRLLPTEDYLSRLEEGLLQCPQFHTNFPP